MKVVGLLSWYDEDPTWLEQATRAALRLCDEVIALDGPYGDLPGASAPDSPREQHDALRRAGARVTRGRIWPTQMAKRSELFRLGLKRTTTEDWFLVFDADDYVAYVATDVRLRLSRTPCDVAVFTHGGDRYHRGLFRALRGLHVEDSHYHYLAEKNGRTVHLRGEERVHDLAPFLNLTDMRVQHRTDDRSDERKAVMRAYRQQVHELGLEPTTPEAWALVPIGTP